MTPVDVLSERPPGSAGETPYVAIAPPWFVGGFALIAVPTTYVTGVVYWRFVGGPTLIVMLTPAVVKPAAFVAVTVYVAAAVTTVGVPEMTPVVVLSVSPAGSAGETPYDVIAPPML